MKIIHYIQSIDKSGGGTTEYIRLLSMALKNDVSLSIATSISENPITIEGVPVKFFNNSVFRWFFLMNEFRTYLEMEKPDIIHINGIWNPLNWGFQKVAQELKIKVLISPHGMLESWILQHNPLKKKVALSLFQHNAIKKADHIHATAQMEKDSIRKLGFNNSITIIPNGIDLSEITKVKTFYGSKKMVFLSRIHPKKGIELLLEAWRTSDTQGWILEIAGNGDENYIKSLAVLAKDLTNVDFVGAKYGESKWDFIRTADIMILPTYSENFGIVIAEALAVGVPVITTKGTPWEDLEKYNCGWWIDLSVTNLQSTLLKVFNTSIYSLEKMGINGQNLVKDKYDINQVAKNIYTLYKNI